MLFAAAAMCVSAFAIGVCKKKSDEEIALDALTKAEKERAAKTEMRSKQEKQTIEWPQKNIELNGKKISVTLM